jgi:membrane protease YdiL (CAAX protease family)
MNLEVPQAAPLGRRSAAWAALGFALVYPTALAWVYFVLLARGAGPNPAFRATYACGKTVQFAFPLFCVWAFDRRLPGLAMPSFRGLRVGVGFGLLVGPGILALYYLLLRSWLLHIGTGRAVLATLREFGADTPVKFALLAAFMAVLHSLLEEYYWRWFTFRWLKRALPVVPAIVISSLAFMAHHVVVLAVHLPGYFLSAVVPFSLCIAGGGAVWSWLYHRTGTIYSAWVSHAIIDGAILLVGYDLVFVHGA